MRFVMVYHDDEEADTLRASIHTTLGSYINRNNLALEVNLIHFVQSTVRSTEISCGYRKDFVAFIRLKRVSG